MIADLACVTFAARAGEAGRDLARYPAVSAWVERVRLRARRRPAGGTPVNPYLALAFTPAVQALQERAGNREAYARQGARPGGNDRLRPEEMAFIAERDGFYVASVSETGWPYVQFRGGPAGFVRTPDPATIAWADFRGNQQFQTAGNVLGEDRGSLFFMDYPGRRRLKVFGRLSFADAADNPSPGARPGGAGLQGADRPDRAGRRRRMGPQPPAAHPAALHAGRVGGPGLDAAGGRRSRPDGMMNLELAWRARAERGPTDHDRLGWGGRIRTSA